MAVAVLFPSIAMAASPTDIIKKNLERALTQNSAYGMEFSFQTDVTETFVGKGKTPTNMSFAVEISSDNYPLSRTTSDASFTIRIPHIRYTRSGISKTYEYPFSVDVKIFDDTKIYVRLATVSDEIKEFLISEDVDVEFLINQWIVIDLQEQLKKLDSNSNTTQKSTEEITARIQNWYLETQKKLGSPIVVTRKKAVTTNTYGEKIQVVSVTFNSRWYTALAKLALDEYKKEHPNATKKRLDAEAKEITEVIKKIRTVVAALQTEVTVNLTTGSIPGFMVNYRKTEPTYDYDYNYVRGKFVSTKKVRGKQTITARSSMQFRPVQGDSLVVPDTAMSIEQAWNIIESKYMSKKSKVSESSSSTLSAF